MKRPGVAAGYGLVGLAMLASWQLASATIVAVVAATAAGLTVLLYADFSRLKATGPHGYGVQVERVAAVEDALAEVEHLSQHDFDSEPADESASGDSDREGSVSANSDVTKFVVPEGFLRRATETMREREAERRHALERLVTEATEWGWTAGVRGSPRPVPKVDWSEDQRPRLVMGDNDADIKMRAIRELLSEATGGLWRGS